MRKALPWIVLLVVGGTILALTAFNTLRSLAWSGDRAGLEDALAAERMKSDELASDIRFYQDLTDIRDTRTIEAFLRFSRMLGAPDTVDKDSPWERFYSFLGHQTRGEWNQVYDFLSASDKENCSKKQFVSKLSQAEPPSVNLLTIAYLGTIRHGNTAWVLYTSGYETQDRFVRLVLEEDGTWHLFQTYLQC